MKTLLLSLIVLLALPQEPALGQAPWLSRSQVDGVARLALSCLERAYPNKMDHVMGGAGDVQAPEVLHPVFFGCLDWHSAVHGHCLLVQVLKHTPDSALAPRIRALLHRRLRPELMETEVAYLRRAESRTFERPYGWAWLLKLAQELETWDDPDARSWARVLEPLTREIVARFLAFFPLQDYPIRTGVHPNTAFALSLAWDYARACQNQPLLQLCEERAKTYFLADRNAPTAWEPGGEDFLSPTLMEADLMRRILTPKAFRTWWQGFLPPEALTPLLVPVRVSDRTDPKIAHLDGLNLSRAWCLSGLAQALPGERSRLLDAAEKHLTQTLPHLNPRQYEGSHWLGTFAMNALLAYEAALNGATSGRVPPSGGAQSPGSANRQEGL